MDPAKIEAAITERTKAIIPVHIQGCPADMDPILEIARKHELHVIEDACQAHGAMYKGRMCGTMGIAGAFSLNNLKNLCGGEGGLFVTNDEDVLKKGDLVRYFGDECDEATLSAEIQRVDPRLHVPQPGTAGRAGPRAARST